MGSGVYDIHVIGFAVLWLKIIFNVHFFTIEYFSKIKKKKKTQYGFVLM